MVENVLPPLAKRVKVIEADGAELFESSHIQPSGCQPAEVPQHVDGPLRSDRGDAEPSQQDEERKQLPEGVMELLLAARGDMEMMLKMVGPLGEVELLRVKPSKTMTVLAKGTAKEVGSRQQTLQHLAATLSTSAARARDQLAMEASYMEDISRLQGRWPVTLVSEESLSGFQIPVHLPSRAATGRKPEWLVQLKQGSSGRVTARVSEASTPIPELAEASAARLESASGHNGVHQALLLLLDDLWWGLIKEGIEAEAAAPNRLPPREAVFLSCLARQLGLLRASSSPAAGAFAPVLRTLFLAAATSPPASTSNYQRQGMAALSSWLRHSYLRSYIHKMLQKQALNLPQEVCLRWVPCGQSHVSVVELRLPGWPAGVLIIRESSLELEGVFDPQGNIHWAKDSCLRILRPEIPFFLEDVMRMAHDPRHSTQQRLQIGRLW